MGEILRVANCNAANFNYPGVRYAGREGTDGAPIDQAVFDSKVGWLSKLLEDQKVDILGLEELFHRKALKDLIEKTTIGADNVFAPDLENEKNVENGEAKGPFCGIVSRYPLSNAKPILDFPPDILDRLTVLRSEADPKSTVPINLRQFQRPVLRADVAIPVNGGTRTVAVFVAHLKSKRAQFLEGEDPKDPVVQALGSARSLIVRAAEAAALRSLVVEATRCNTNPVIVLGDLNDDLTSVTTQAIAGDEPWFLPAAEKKAAYDALLYSAHDIQEQNSHRSVAYSHIYNGRYELLDHIFLSQEFVVQNPDRIAQVKNTRVFNDHLFDSRLEGDRSVRTMNTSDHGIPICEIEWRNIAAPAP